MKYKKFIPWIPSVVTAVLAVITCILYTVWGARRGAMGYFQLFGCMLVPALFPLYGLIFKKPLPTVMSAVVAVQVVFANFMGTILDFYIKIPWWDLFMHGSFGFVGGVLAYGLLVRWNGEKLNKFGFYFLILCFVLCLGVLWEIFEYVTDGIFPQNDAQVTKGLEGRAAVADTMEDLMISVAGVAVFYLCAAVDYIAGTRVLKKSLVDTQKPKEEISADAQAQQS